MKRIFFSLAFAVIFVMSPVLTVNAGEIGGNWINQQRTTKILMTTCANYLCGIITWTKQGGADENNPKSKLRSRDLKGVEIMPKMTPFDEGVWKGKYYEHTNGKTYNATVVLDHSTQFTVKNCIGFTCNMFIWNKY